MIVTSGDHAPIAMAAAQTGLHVFVEKPMALCSWRLRADDRGRRNAGVQLMVGTMKRYDPAYERLGELLTSLRPDLRLVRVTTLESPFAPYVAHYPLFDGEERCADILSAHGQADAQRVDVRLVRPTSRLGWCYRWILLDNLVHEFNALRGVLGEPTEVVSADLSRDLREHQPALRRDRLPPNVGRSARDRAVQAAVRVLRAGPAPDARTAVAVLAQRPEPAPRRRAARRAPPTAGSARSSCRTRTRSSASWREFADCVAAAVSHERRGRTGSQTCGSARPWPVRIRASIPAHRVGRRRQGHKRS